MAVALDKIRSSLTRFFPRHGSAVPDQEYLLGLRGFFVIQCFVWMFLHTFAPVAVKGSANTSHHHCQEILRKTLSVLFWNDNIIYSFFVLISARTICIPFFKDPTKTNVASAAFRRGIRLFFPTAVALAIVKATFSCIGTRYIDDYKVHTGNVSFQTPYHIPNALAYFNSVFNLFWITHQFAAQAGSYAFPTQTLWIVSLIYSQSFTVYMTMLITPYTRRSWRVKAFLCFIIAAWWVQSWAWYTVTGLLFADMVMHMNFKEKANRGISIWRNIRCPVWVPYTVITLAGFIMQYLWTAWRPEWANAELRAHTGLYYTGGLNTEYDLSQPQARDDAYLILVGLFFFVETYDWLQMILKNPLFVYLGKRSLSWFLVQAIVIYTAGVKLFMHLNVEKSWPHEGSVVTCLVVCLVAVITFAEIFHRLVDYPSQVVAHVVFDWIRK